MAIKARVEFAVPEDYDSRLLDDWLSVAFGVSLQGEGGVAARRSSTSIDSASSFLGRVLLLARELLIAGRVPVFSVAQVVSLERSSKTRHDYAAVIVVPVAGDQFFRCFLKSFGAALDACAKMSCEPVADESRQAIFVNLEQHVVTPLRAVMPVAKSTLAVLQAAHAMGVPFMPIGLGVYQLGWGSRSRRIDRSTTDRDSSMGAKLAGDKAASAQLLRTAGLPAPVHAVARDEQEALVAAGRIGFPLVVKPLDRDRGEGVHVDILDDEGLLAAFSEAMKATGARRLIVERQVAGVCHRIFVACGRLLYAVKRLPMSVCGDGSSSVATLVAREYSFQQNRPPWNRSEIRPLDALAVAAMRMVGYSPQDVPVNGCLVPLRRIESTAWGGVDEDVTDCVHPENVSVALTAAALFGLEVAGIDIISEDIAVPWHENGAIINEVNFAPLLGGGEISRRHIPEFIRRVIPDGGRIPVRSFNIGDEARALACWAEFRKTGLRCCITSASETLSASGQGMNFRFQTLDERIRALLSRQDVDAIVAIRGEAIGIAKLIGQANQA